MPTRVPKQTVIIRREGVSVIPEVGKPYVFTDEELKEINAVAPNALRKPINEGEPELPFINGQNQPDNSKAGKGAKTGKDGKETKDDEAL